MQCFQELGHPTMELMLAELTDDGLLASTCSAGHSTFTALQEQKHELLFDLAVMAMIDGYPREAVTGYAAALERFYEFATRVIATKQGISQDAFDTTYKSLSKLSERQLGGFMVAYLLESKSAPQSILNSKPIRPEGQSWQQRTWTEFRNNVVHNGYLPSSQESIAYGSLVYDHIIQLTQWLISRCPDALQSVSLTKLDSLHKSKAGRFVSTMSTPTILSPNRESFGKLRFVDAIAQVKEYKERMHHA